MIEQEDYLSTAKFPGIPEKVNEKRKYELQVPEFDPGAPSLDNLPPNLHQMIKQLSDSKALKYFKIEYVLELYVKHQSKLELG